MICPKCKVSMVTLELNNVEIDKCFKCDGVWLDEGELEILLQGSKLGDEILYSIIPSKQSREKPVKCPVCRKKMAKIIAGGNISIVLDKCNREHGIWFDGGELEKIIHLAEFGEGNEIYKFINEIFGKEL
jgi:Zn-finger nucleic acid-binding protein